jgi:GNAT superfamily N-acetyltransferase
MSFIIENLADKKGCIPTVSEWIFSEFIKDKYKGISKSNIIKALNNRYLDNLPMTYIGILNSECIGTISLFSNDLNKRQDLTPWLAALYISEEYRNLGYARKLISFITDKAQALGFKKIYLRTETTSEYYKKLGWTQMFDTIDDNGLNTTVFEKTLIPKTTSNNGGNIL